MKHHFFEFGDVRVCLQGDGPDEAAKASIETGRCVVLISPVHGGEFVGIVFDDGLAVFGCVESTAKKANSTAYRAIREVYPNAQHVGDLA